jgi:hypothetical protein
VVATDKAGNATTATNNQTVIVDQTAPAAAATVTALSSDSGSSTSDFITNAASQTVSGTFTGALGAGETIQVSANGGATWVTATAGAGTWSAGGVTLSNGAGTLSVRTIDTAGNTTAGIGHSYTLDTTAPTISNLAAAHNHSPSVTGTVSDTMSESETIHVLVSQKSGNNFGPFTEVGTTTVNVNGTTAASWSLNPSLGNGDKVEAYAVDAAGNQSAIVGPASAPAGIAGSPINLALTDLASGEAVTLTISGMPSGWTLNQGTENSDSSWSVQTNDPSSLTVTTSSMFAGAVVLSVSENWTNSDGNAGTVFVADNVEVYPASPIFAVSGDDTLTGGTAGNNEFVFAQPIGNDTIYNFKTASDTIDLIGFGMSGVGALSIAEDASGNAVVTLASGETITLVGIDSASLSASNFVFDQEPVTGNAGTMTIGNGAILPLGGTIDNTGTITLQSAGDESDLEILVRGASLTGGGQVVLSDNSANVVFGGDASAILDNLDNTISGAGQLGQGQLTLHNEGVIAATGTNALVIDTGANTVISIGTLRADGAGGLIVDSAISGGGAAVIGATSHIEFGAAADAAVNFDAGAAGTLKLDQSSTFTGTIAGFASADGLDLADIGFSAGATLGYVANASNTGGGLTVNDGTHTTNLALLGQYAASGFQTASDQGGGTIITYTQPQTSTADQSLLSNPQHTA